VTNTALDSNRRTAAASLRVLLADLIDYAGLFPPAGLSMDAAVENYSRYLASADSWALARFVVPVSRLEEFEAARAKCVESHSIWRVSALLGPEAEADAAEIRRFNDHNQQSTAIDAVDAKAASEADIQRIAGFVPSRVAVFFELHPDIVPKLLPTVKAVNAKAKIRTGGVTPDMFPAPAAVAGFIRECARVEVAFKATAGLHHPLRCMKPLTYEANAPKGIMHGFLNVFVAAALALRGEGQQALSEALESRDARAFEFSDEGVRFHDSFVATQQLESMRRTFAISFGSCSFEEPMADLRELGLL
jgi:hypothetical protein